MWATGDPAGRADAGATLLEMLVVVAILAMVGALTFADFRPALAHFRLETARTEVASAAASARAVAMRSGDVQTLTVDADGAGLSAGPQRRVLPAGVRLAPASAAVVFSPDGEPGAGQRFVLSDGRARLPLEVEPGSGLVLVPSGGR